MDAASTQVRPGAAASLPGQRHRLLLPDGSSCTLYLLGPLAFGGAEEPPLLLVHSINATASAFEMGPIAQRQSRRRAVIALDLPGFGSSEKTDRRYSPAQMRTAINAAIDWIGAQVSTRPIDLMALSLGCEFAAESALRKPARVRTLTLISPTGMEGRRVGERYEDGRTREQAWLRGLLRENRLGSQLYRLLTTQTSMRWFLSRAWGTTDFSPALLEHGRMCAALPGARYAPLDFVSGALFTRGVIERYRALQMPLWVVHGNQGSFTDFEACPTHTDIRAGLAACPVERTVIDGGSMPHFESLDAFDAAYQHFLSDLQGRFTRQPPPPPLGRTGQTSLEAVGA